MPITLTNEDALVILERKVGQPGQLQIITATHQCLDGDGNVRGENSKGVPSTPMEQAACAVFAAAHSHPGYAEPLADPTHFVTLDVVRVEGPDARGLCTAFAEDGSFTMGYPANLLSKLTEVPAHHAMVAAASP